MAHAYVAAVLQAQLAGLEEAVVPAASPVQQVMLTAQAASSAALAALLVLQVRVAAAPLVLLAGQMGLLCGGALVRVQPSACVASWRDPKRWLLCSTLLQLLQRSNSPYLQDGLLASLGLLLLSLTQLLSDPAAPAAPRRMTLRKLPLLIQVVCKAESPSQQQLHHPALPTAPPLLRRSALLLCSRVRLTQQMAAPTLLAQSLPTWRL